MPDERDAPAVTEMPRLGLDRQRLRELQTKLRSWLAQPLQAMGADALHYSINLASEPSDRLVIEFGTRDEVITVPGGVGCLVELAHSGMVVKVAFATDPTCLEILAEGVAVALGGHRNP